MNETNEMDVLKLSDGEFSPNFLAIAFICTDVCVRVGLCVSESMNELVSV